jgi:hypothetical protein
MAYEVRYDTDKAEDRRRAICDLIRWLGLRRSIAVFTDLRRIEEVREPVEFRNQQYRKVVNLLGFLAGVEGAPVWETIRYVAGEEQYAAFVAYCNQKEMVDG